ncbi:guanylate-binding protein 2-like [Branchiostoma lanceolatum]|uniref:guanylate-binding protein 2-like n=1 Tax=Branchiostoma lanceolatum TaxID=7740 RepID=UPI0034513CDE
MDHPIKLTSTRVVGDQTHVVLTAEAKRVLADLPPRSVDIVAVMGPMRKGKSHLANLLCKRRSGFPLGDTLKPKTKDFWFWIGTHPVQTDRYLMVVDSEGLGDYSDEEQNEKDLKYLALATLLSNHLVFNLQGNLDSGLVSHLRLMGDLAERIRVQKDGNDEGNNLGDHFPELWVVVQDTHLKPPEKDDGSPQSPDEFLEDMLERKDGHTKAIRSHNEMTAAVKAFFPKRHLRLIPAPAIEADVLSNLDKVDASVLQTGYNEAVDEFTREIWESGQVKRVNGDEIKSTGLLYIMNYYVDAINDPNVMPSVLGAHEAMADGECRRASEEQMKTFHKTVEETVEPLMPMDEETCNKRIKTAADNAVSKLFADVGKWDKDGTWKKSLQEKLEIERLALLMANGSTSHDLCDKIIKEAGQGVRQKVERGDYNTIDGYDMYDRDMEKVYHTYKQRASGKGPAFDKVLETFRATEMTWRNTINDTARKLKEEDRRLKEERRRRQEAEAAAEMAAERERAAVAMVQPHAAPPGGGADAAEVAAVGLYAIGQGFKAVAYLAALALQETAREN